MQQSNSVAIKNKRKAANVLLFFMDFGLLRKIITNICLLIPTLGIYII